MKVCYDKCGSQLRSMAEYPIAPTERVLAGQVVMLVNGRVVPAERRMCEPILGIAGEDHTGKQDALNSRAVGESILIYDSPMAVCESPAPEVIAAGGERGCVIAGEGLCGDFADNAFAGEIAVLTAGGQDIADGIGTAYEICASHGADRRIFLAGMHGTPLPGDRFAILPPLLFSGGVLDEERQRLALSDTCPLSLRVIGRDAARKRIFMLARRHVLAVSGI
ncbi:MAG: hypothetical protein IKL89_01055 [Clostridia bacterium]|nr:hypothetical protein [Clostridia bacterium]